MENVKKVLFLTFLAIGCSSVSVFAKEKNMKLMATCPTVAVISSTNPSDPPWGLQDIQGTAPYHFTGAEIKFIKVGTTEEAEVTCKYLDSNKVLNRALTQFSSPVVDPHTCSFVINEHGAVKCPYDDPSKCTIYCSS